MHSTIHAVCVQQKGQKRAKSHIVFTTDIKKIKNKLFFFSQKGRASFRLFQKGRASRKRGRAKEASRQNTEYYTYLGALQRKQKSKITMEVVGGPDLTRNFFWGKRPKIALNQC